MLDELKAALVNEDKEGIESEVERIATLYNLPIRSIRAVKPIYDTNTPIEVKGRYGRDREFRASREGWNTRQGWRVDRTRSSNLVRERVGRNGI